MLIRWAAVGLAVALAGGGGASAAESELASLRPEAVEIAAPRAGGAQFVGADQKGRLVLVRGTPPAFYEIRSRDDVRAWGEAEARRGVLETAGSPILDAAFSSDGSWVLLTLEGILRVSRHEAEVLADPRWLPLGVAMAGAPLAAVIPVVEGRVRPPRFDPSAPPLVLEHGSSGWRPLVEEAFTDTEAAAPPGEGSLRAFRALALARAAGGGVWAAHRYLYRVRRFSPAGRERLDLTLAPSPVPAELDEDAVEELRGLLAERAALLGETSAVLRPFTAKPVVEDLVEGRDGKLYLYVAPGAFGGEALLDRYDPATQRLERAVLELDPPGRVSLAAGRDALWIAAVRGDHQLWRIPWSVLDSLAWQAVSGLHLDGLPVAP